MRTGVSLCYHEKGSLDGRAVDPSSVKRTLQISPPYPFLFDAPVEMLFKKYFLMLLSFARYFKFLFIQQHFP